jgi:hypothetical protein
MTVFAFIHPGHINNDWKALEFLAARRYPHLDFLINLPLNTTGRQHYKPIRRVIGHDRRLDELQLQRARTRRLWSAVHTAIS